MHSPRRKTAALSGAPPRNRTAGEAPPVASCEGFVKASCAPSSSRHSEMRVDPAGTISRVLVSGRSCEKKVARPEALRVRPWPQPCRRPRSPPTVASCNSARGGCDCVPPACGCSKA
eukprot:3579512-Prymnesium_polylepis.1